MEPFQLDLGAVIGNTNINLIDWFIQQLSSHCWITLNDRMQVCIPLS